MITLYHGTFNATPILEGNMSPLTWLAGSLAHAYRIAERRVSQRKIGNAIVCKIRAKEECFKRVIGRDLPTYQYIGGEYECISTFEMVEKKVCKGDR